VAVEGLLPEDGVEGGEEEEKGYPDEEAPDGEPRAVVNGPWNGAPEPKGGSTPSGGANDAIFLLWDGDWRERDVACMGTPVIPRRPLKRVQRRDSIMRG
jgi:hypothetical protein